MAQNRSSAPLRRLLVSPITRDKITNTLRPTERLECSVGIPATGRHIADDVIRFRTANKATPIAVRKSVYSRRLEILHGSVSELTCSKAPHVAPAYLPKLHKRVCHMSHIPSSSIECASDLRADLRKSGRCAKCQKNRISKRRPRAQVM
jgi:hypothetical protein